MGKEYTQEELQHYRDHPDEVDATDTVLVDALSGIESAILGVAEEGTEKVVDPDAEDAAKAKAEADAAIAAQEKAEAEAKAKAGQSRATQEENPKILTPDGKSTIPFAVLKDERAGRAAAEGALTEAQQTILSLSERLKAIEAGKADPGGAGGEKTADELEEMLASLTEDAPWLEKLKPLVDRVRAAEALLLEYEGEREETEAQHLERLQTSAATALDNNPTLVLWKTQAPALFQEAVDFDHSLRNNPRQAGRFRSFDERYARVVELVKASHAGEALPLPEAIAPASSTAAAPAAARTAAGKPSAAELKARADAALRKAEDQSITTLSDIPGGVGEVGTEEALERMDVTQIADKFARMGSSQEILNWVMTH